MKNLGMLFTVVLLAANVYGVLGDVWNAADDWGGWAAGNPAGSPAEPNLWSYRTGADYSGQVPPLGYGEILPNYGGTWGSPAGWKRTTGDGAPIIFHGPWNLGVDVIDNISLGGHPNLMVRWTSPTEGLVVVSGWGYGANNADPRHLVLKQNDATFSEDDIRHAGPTDRLYFEDMASGPAALYRNVVVGDTIDMVINSGGFCGFNMIITEVNELPQVNLTMEIRVDGGASGDPSSAVTPSPSGSPYPYILGFNAIINANRHVNCPDVLQFSHWEGDGIVNPLAASTEVLMDADKTITAVYVDGRECGDECYPIMQMDFNSDCVVNLSDFGLFAQVWLDCNKPDGCL